MSLIDEAKNLRAPKGPQCTVGRLLATLTDEQANEVRDAIADPTVPASGLSKALEARGWGRVQAQTIQRHRRRECTCD